MAEMKISNTLVKDSGDRIIAFGKQLKDDNIDWTSEKKKYNGSYPDPEDPTKSIPYIPDYDPEHPDVFSKTESNKFQSRLNEFFLDHWADWQKFLHDEGVQSGIIDSWKEVQDFLKGISDDEAMTLLTFITTIELASGTLNIRMSEDYPGAVEAVETSSDYNVSNSKIDPETGAIKIVFNFERDI